MDDPPETAKAARRRPPQSKRFCANNGAGSPILQTREPEREILMHALAVQHQQRAMMLEGLQSLNAKLDALMDLAMRKGGEQ
jgi:hypothetical protein